MWCRTTPTVHPSPGTAITHSASLHDCAKAIASALAAAKSSASCVARSLAMGHPRQRAQVLDAPAAGRAALNRGPDGHPLEQCVDRRGDAVQPPQQHDLAVEVLGLNGARPPGQAL